MASAKTHVVLRFALMLNAALLLIGFVRFGFSGLFYDDDDDRPNLKEIRIRGKGRSNVPSSSSSSSSSEFLVPNVVHYIWYNTDRRPLQFHHMLSVLSAHKILQPDIIYFHTNKEPTGPYWKRVKQLSNFRINHREPPEMLFGERIKEPFYYTSHSNVDRVKILMEYGGIYLDFDVLVTRPFDDLRRYPCAIGREQETKACGSVIVCSRQSPFLLLWINSYIDDYQITEWAYNTGQVPFNLARRFPHLVHLDEDRINRPNFMELDLIWGPKRFAWQNNYAVHLWYRLWKDSSPYFDGVEPNDENIKTWNATFGEMARSIMYGVKGIMEVY